MIVGVAVDVLARGADDGAGAALAEQTEVTIGFRGCELDDAERMNDRYRHPVLADAEIPPGAFGLRAPVAIAGNLDRTEAVGLYARGMGSRCRCRSSHESCPLREAVLPETSLRWLRAAARSFY